MFLHSYEHTTPPTYHLELFFSVASYHLAWGLTPFSSFLCHQRTSFHFHFQSKIEILQAYLRVHPHKHMCTQKTHMQIHTDAHSLWTWTSFVCLSATRGEKKDWRRKWKKECWRKRREGSVRRTYLHWWMKWTHVVFCVAICLRDSNHCQKRDRQRILPLSGSGLAEWQENEYIFKLSYI